MTRSEKNLNILNHRRVNDVPISLEEKWAKIVRTWTLKGIHTKDGSPNFLMIWDAIQ